MIKLTLFYCQKMQLFSIYPNQRALLHVLKIARPTPRYCLLLCRLFYTIATTVPSALWLYMHLNGQWRLCPFDLLNPFPHIYSFWCLCSRRLFENMATKEEIAQNEQFLLLSPCFQLYLIIVLSFKGSFKFIPGMFSKSSAAYLLYVEKG